MQEPEPVLDGCGPLTFKPYHSKNRDPILEWSLCDHRRWCGDVFLTPLLNRVCVFNVVRFVGQKITFTQYWFRFLSLAYRGPLDSLDPLMIVCLESLHYVSIGTSERLRLWEALLWPIM